jgi:hypothetical protein
MWVDIVTSVNGAIEIVRSALAASSLQQWFHCIPFSMFRLIDRRFCSLLSFSL